MRIKKTYFGLLVIFSVLITVFLACSKEETEPDEYEPVVYELAYRYPDVTQNDYFELTHQNLQSPEEFQLEHSSGLAVGRKNPNFVYICQGRGIRSYHPQSQPAELYVYNHDAVYQGKIILDGIENIDWQDLAIGPGPEDGKTYIYIGDIGDKEAQREFLTIYRVAEPQLGDLNVPFEITLSEIEAINYSVPEPRTAETLMIDPISKDLIVIAKMQAFVYRIPYPQSTTEINEAWFKGFHRMRIEIKAGDISPNGRYIQIKDVGEIFHWVVEEGEDPVQVMFEQVPTISAYQSEIEGGALGWTADSNGYFTITDTDIHDDGARRGQPILFGYSKK